MSVDYHRKLNFYNSSSNLFENEVLYSLYLDINQRDIIADASFTISNPEIVDLQFSRFIDSIKGQSITNIDEISEESAGGFSIPYALLVDAIGKFTKENLNIQGKCDLICRCFNIGKGEILDAINNGRDSVFKVADETRASTGCGSCKQDIEQLLKMVGKEPIRILNKTNVEWILYFDELLNEYFDGSEKRPQIISFKNTELNIETSEWNEKLEQFISQKSPILLKVSFS